MSKYNKEFKLAVIQHYLSGRGGFKTAADQYGVKCAYVRKWVHAFRAHGQKSFVKGHAKYSSTFKLSVLQHMEQHQLSINQAASHFNIPAPSTISHWQRLYNEGGITALANRQRGQQPMSQFNIKALLKKPISELTPAEMRRRLESAEAEAAYLKKLEALAQSKAVKENKPK